jgi:hypothetical protein
MTYLLDTNSVSETVRTRPNAHFASWLSEVPDSSLHVSVLTLGEIRKGIEGQRDHVRREQLNIWLTQSLANWFGPRVLPVGPAEADRWGRLAAAVGKSIPIVDSLIAATALHHNLRIVTRNERDFARFPGLQVVNPWRR